jgi:hypothetical protein
MTLGFIPRRSSLLLRYVSDSHARHAPHKGTKIVVGGPAERRLHPQIILLCTSAYLETSSPTQRAFKPATFRKSMGYTPAQIRTEHVIRTRVYINAKKSLHSTFYSGGCLFLQATYFYMRSLKCQPPYTYRHHQLRESPLDHATGLPVERHVSDARARAENHTYSGQSAGGHTQLPSRARHMYFRLINTYRCCSAIKRDR